MLHERCDGVVTRPVVQSLCRRPVVGEHVGTYSVTSLGGVGSTFLLEWLKRLHRVYQQQPASCSAQNENASAHADQCACPVLGQRGALPRHLVSCHIEDDGIYKHLADPAPLKGLGGHRAVYLVGSPLNGLASIFRRRYQCWHMHRLHDCWFTRKQRNGRIACDSAAIAQLRRQYGEEAATCRVPPVGPLSSLAAYAQHGRDLFGSIDQFSAWLNCRAPRCTFDILVIRYEAIRESLPMLFDFLQLPPRTRALFPYEQLRDVRARRRARPRGMSAAAFRNLSSVYGALEAAVERIPAEGLWLRNT